MWERSSGPALAGLLISVDGPGLACVVLACLCLSAALLARVQPLRANADNLDEEAGALGDLLAAARVILLRPNTRAPVSYTHLDVYKRQPVWCRWPRSVTRRMTTT